MTEKFCMCSAYLFEIFIGDISSTEIFQQNKNFMRYIIRVSHETPNMRTIEIIPMASVSFYSIFLEYTIY